MPLWARNQPTALREREQVGEMGRREVVVSSAFLLQGHSTAKRD